MPCSGGPLVKTGVGKCKQQSVHRVVAVVWLPSCPSSPSAAGDRAGAGVLGKELRDEEVQEGDQCLRPAGRRLLGEIQGRRVSAVGNGDQKTA